MMKVLLIDSNKTIENLESVKERRNELFDNVYQKTGIARKDTEEFLSKFSEQFPNVMWECHPIFWRLLSKRILNEDQTDILYDEFLKVYEKYIVLYKDAIKFLYKYKNRYKLGLIANGNAKRLGCLIKKFKLNKIFEIIIISGETPYKKPDTFIFEIALKDLQVESQCAVMIGDRLDTDILGAQQLGIKTILLDRNSYYLNAEKVVIPDFVVTDFTKVGDILKNIEEESLDKANQTKISSAIILAGGKGSRLGNIGKQYQKCMLPIKGKPLLYYIIQSFIKQGCKKFILIVNHLSDQVKDYFKSGNELGISIEYVEKSFSSTYEALYKAIELIEDDYFFYCHGNILFDESLVENMLSLYNQKEAPVISVMQNTTDITHAKIQLKDKYINKVVTNKADKQYSLLEYVFMGIAIYSKKYMNNWCNSNIKGMSEEIISQLLMHGVKTFAVECHQQYYHIESISDYIKVNQNIKDGELW